MNIVMVPLRTEAGALVEGRSQGVVRRLEEGSPLFTVNKSAQTITVALHPGSSSF